MEACEKLAAINIDVEVIDIQTLLPFDVNHLIKKSVAKTNRLLVLDEDVPGGASAFIMQQIVDEQEAYQYLDSKPATLAAKSHRAAYGSDGDYFSKPSVDDIFDKIYDMMHECKPALFPVFY
jgi:pyruvate/2-oxoglutarate/acetoin dehydrogenase E1 component